jgi:hypothetical protein
VKCGHNEPIANRRGNRVYARCAVCHRERERRRYVPRTQQPRPCDGCGVVFMPSHAGHRYHSESCWNAAWYRRSDHERWRVTNRRADTKERIAEQIGVQRSQVPPPLLEAELALNNLRREVRRCRR